VLSLVEAAGERLASSNGWSSAAARLKQRIKLHKTRSKCDANLKTILDRAGGCRPPTDNVLEKRNAVQGCALLYYPFCWKCSKTHKQANLIAPSSL